MKTIRHARMKRDAVFLCMLRLTGEETIVQVSGTLLLLEKAIFYSYPFCQILLKYRTVYRALYLAYN